MPDTYTGGGDDDLGFVPDQRHAQASADNDLGFVPDAQHLPFTDNSGKLHTASQSKSDDEVWQEVQADKAKSLPAKTTPLGGDPLGPGSSGYKAPPAPRPPSRFSDVWYPNGVSAEAQAGAARAASPRAAASKAAGMPLAPVAGGPNPTELQAPAAERIRRGQYWTNTRTGQRVALPDVPETEAIPVLDAWRGIEPVATGLSRFSENDKPTYGVDPNNRFGPPVRTMTPEEEERQRRQRVQGATEVLQGSGQLMEPIAAGTALVNPVPVFAGYGTGYLASEGIGAAAHGHVSPEDEELIRTASFFLPSLAGMLAGVKSSYSKAPGPRGTSVREFSAFGDKVGGGVRVTPEDVTVGARIGDTQIGKRFSRGFKYSKEPLPPDAAETAPVSDTPNNAGQQLQLPQKGTPFTSRPPVPITGTPHIPEPSEAAKALASFEQHTGNPDFQPAPPPPAPPGANGPEHLTPDVVKGVSDAIMQAPAAKRPNLMTEAHGNMVKWMMGRGTFTGPDGKIHTVDAEGPAKKLASKFINDEVERRDAENDAMAAHDRNMQRPAVPPETQAELDSMKGKPVVVAPRQAPQPKPSPFNEGDAVPAMATPEMLAQYGRRGLVPGQDGRFIKKPEPPEPNPVTAEYPEIAAQADALRGKLPTSAPVSGKPPAGKGLTTDTAAVVRVAREADIHPEQQPAILVKKEPPKETAALAKPAAPVNAEDVGLIGKEDKESGRTILQPSDDVMQNERLAAAGAPELATRLSHIAAGIPGARFDRIRPQKELERVDEKVDEAGKPPETVPDYLAAQIAVDTVEAKNQLIRALRREFPVISVEDKFLEGRPKLAGYPSANVQVQMSTGGTAEIQLVPREVQETSNESHKFYTAGREAELRGDTAEHKKQFAEATKLHDAAMEKFHERNDGELGFKPDPQQQTERTTPDVRNPAKHEFASTQINIDPQGELGQAHAQAVAAIPKEHVGKEGLEKTPHVTIRYGLKDDSPASIEKIKAAAAQIQPFEVPIGKTDVFPATEHSSFDHPAIARLETTPELKALRKVVEGAGAFKEDNFPEYKPHVTLGYIKKEFAQQYKGGNQLEGKTVPVNEITVTKRNGSSEVIKLGGDSTGNPAHAGDRRTNLTERKRIEDMTTREKDEEIRRLRHAEETDKLTGVKSRAAFLADQAHSPAKALGAIDLDGLKAINDKMGGHHSGDVYIKEVTRLLKNSGLDLYRTGGDEFYARSDSKDGLAAKIENANQIIQSHDFEFTGSDGSKWLVKGLGLSYGVGTEWRPGEDGQFEAPDAERALYEQKQQRLTEGHRGERGELGRNVRSLRQERPSDRGSESDTEKAVSAEQIKKLERQKFRLRGQLKTSATSDELAQYFKPGNIVYGYGGIRDKVIAFHPTGQYGWSVDVVNVDKDGNPIKGERQRNHSTQPSAKELIESGVRDSIKEKIKAIDEQIAQVKSQASSGPRQATLTQSITDPTYERARGVIKESGLRDTSEHGDFKPVASAEGKAVSFEHPRLGRWVNLPDGGRKFLPSTITSKATDIQGVADVMRLVEAKANQMHVPVPDDVRNLLAAAPEPVADAMGKLFAEPLQGEQNSGDLHEATTPGQRERISEGLPEVQPRGSGAGAAAAGQNGISGPGVAADHPTVEGTPGQPSGVEPKPTPDVRNTQRLGRPIIAGQLGNKTQLKMANGETLPSRYKLVEAEDITASHHPTRFTVNRSYPDGVQERQYHRDKRAQARIDEQTRNFDPDVVINTDPTPVNGPPMITPDGIALGGNSRTMTIQRVYAFGLEQPYIDMLKERAAHFGLDADAVDSFTHPVLVREIAKPPNVEDARRIGSALNKVPTAALGSSEQAVSASKRVTDDTRAAISRMALDIGPDATLKDVIARSGRKVLSLLEHDGAITAREMPLYVDTSATHGVSEEGKQFIERAMRGYLVDDPELMERVPKSIFNKLDTSLADISILGSRHDDYNIVPLLRQALEKHAEIGERGLTVEDYMGQSGLFGGSAKNPAVDALVRTLGEKPTAVRRAVHQFTIEANLDAPGQALLVAETPTAVASFNASFGSDLTPDEFTAAMESGNSKGKTNYRLPVGGKRNSAPATAPKTQMPAPETAAGGPTLLARKMQRGFFDKDVKPTLEGAAGGLTEIANKAIRFLAPRVGVPPPSLDALMRLKGRREEELYKFTKANEGVTKFFNRLPESERTAYVDRMKRGEKQPTPELEQIAEMHRAVLARFRAEEKQYKPHFEDKENYFPVRWKVVPGTEKQDFSGFLRRPLQGPKTFTKEQTLPDMTSGLEAGGVPVTTNPQTMIEHRIAESLTFTTAQQLFRDLEEIGNAAKVDLGGKAPTGFVRISDPSGQIYRNPMLPVTEYFDQQIWDGLNDFAKSLGIKHERGLKIGTPAMGVSTGNTVKTKTGTSLDTLMHEIGHQIQDRTGFVDKIVRDPRFAKELRDLAELRYEGMTISDSQKAYVHSKDEKAAMVIESLLFAREKFQKVAPRVYDWITTFLKQDPTLKPLLDIRPGLVSGSRTDELFAGGPVIGGSWYFEPNTARVLENFLGRDRIREVGLGRGIIRAKNATTAWRLSFSPFHLLTETGLATGSELGRGLEHLWNQGVRQGSIGEMGKGAAIFAKAPVAAVTAAREGGSLIRHTAATNEAPTVKQFSTVSEFLESARAKGFLKTYPDAAALLSDLFTGGAKLAMHEDFRIDALQGLERALADHNYFGGLIRTPGTFAQGLQYPLFEVYIPRLKIGMFLREYSEALQDRQPDIEAGAVTREKLARQIWDSVEHRFGEMNWDNFFWNRTFKSAMQVGLRAAAWTIGNARFVGSAATGQAREFWQSFKYVTGSGEVDPSTTAIPKLDPRMAKLIGMTIIMVIINTLLHYAMTGEHPRDLKDLLAPKDGTLDKDGRPNRVLVPFVPFTDAISLVHSPANYAKGKLADIWTAVPETINNRDFQGHLISNPGDAYWKQVFDRAAHVVGTPIGIDRYRKARAQGDSVGKAAAGALGVKSAPREWDMTAAENLAHKLASNHPDYRPYMTDEQLAEKERKGQERAAAEAAGDIEHVTQLEHDFKYLTAEDAYKVMQQANQGEKDRLRSMYLRKRLRGLSKAQMERGRSGKEVPDYLYEEQPQ